MVYFFETSVAGSKYTIYAPESKEENSQIVSNAFPSDVWLNINGSKYLPAYLRQPIATVVASALNLDDLPSEAIKAAVQILKHQANTKREVNITYTFASNLSLNGPIDPKQVGTTISKTKKTDVIADPDLLATQTKRKVDFEAERLAYDEQLRKQSSAEYRKQQKSERESSRQYKELAEQNRKGYTDLYADEDLVKQSSNQNRDSDWEDDFM